MARYEYKVVPAPSKGVKGKGIKGPEARFSNALQQLMNQLAAEGWEYQRAETLPSVERSGLTSTTTEWRNVLIFRKPVAGDIAAFAPELLAAPTEQMRAAPDAPASDTSPSVAEADGRKTGTDGSDNGVEDTNDVSQVSATPETLLKSRNNVNSDR